MPELKNVIIQDSQGDQIDVDNDSLPVSFKSNLSAFGDLITNEMTPIVQYAFEYDMVNNTKVWKKTEVESGTAITTTAMAYMATGTTTASSAHIESVRPARYRSGFGGKFRFTARFTAPASGCRQIVGIFDEVGSTLPFKNGYGIGFDGTTLKLHLFTNDTDNSINYINPTGITIDTTKLNIFEIDYAYLGTGDIIYRIYDTAKRKFVEIARIQRSNTEAVPHVYNPNFKLRMYASNGATTSDVGVYSASMMYAIMGTTKQRETQQYVQSYNTSLESITTKTQIFSVRSKTTYTSVSNLIDALLLNMSGSYQANANGRGSIEIQLNPTLAGTASWSDISTTNSIFEVDTAQTTVTAPGQVLAKIYFAGQFDKENLVDLISEQIIISPGDEIAILGESTASATISAFVSWRELI